ncbi:1-acyl-sn-glycerol-3-phosphate acyltransferase [Ponticoccus sp. SC2-23]|uniref:lysophospholipid acyltransferase family protein n=1 Tax=Alexandriicola marinus TaxID=2081710 RepID=UPI000FD6EA0C|nr:lysophospholipid acyltransferase family protein [Alexandriicola marinus]MBM1218781.1 1-acyl-sn-glycerol-3-phosphate acyltransferase [Ponticoccus sp. SC6-9]MBM1224147.1 1-acyl-sn-glycerol-3-phosphate acyltransferase [Ponticoccus sp. SC6-15]MBM1230074.1 1-acyl-sn-glycerol-3-phosphate acyltransferase [Ponticoccus sp. SC6-38]MBM1233113.1 1-acyl-sn-glycerol-3-phosphate acyltransferase [Ponticoccus sp. SC6-45]MBM1236937.1 1-acyl-sn-glycerol-3-phosphate acyltransferase [Ponticoccus sp. SC6-49]MBM
MTPTWRSETEPAHPSIGTIGWVRAVLRAVPLILVTFGGLALLLVLRLIERPVFGLTRPVTPYITQAVCRVAFVILGIRHRIEGRPITGEGAVVANHSSWLDIFALNARQRVYFVSKAEVAGWAGIGWLARATGTLFIERDRRQASDHVRTLEQRLHAGHQLLFFPEGTSTDGRRVLPFKPTLFAAFLSDDLRHDMVIQPVSVVYHAPKGAEPRFYGWWGDMEFGPHLLSTLAAGRQGDVRVVYHPPVAVADYPDRKSLAAALERIVRDGVETRLG